MNRRQCGIPSVSIIMGIYNCAETLEDAIRCILKQTYLDWELIMCNDGSTDNTLDIAQMYADTFPEKIIVLKNDKNKGLNYTLNRCLEYAKGRYIARMDGDDLCSETRLEEEVKVLENEPEISIVSSQMDYFDEEGIWGHSSSIEYPHKSDFVKGTPFCHAPCMVRREAYEAVNGYSESKRLIRVEDYHLWIKMYSMGFKGKNINKSLYQMRDGRNAYSRRKFRYRINEAYVKMLAVKMLKLPAYNYIFALRPIVVGLLPNKLYDRMHKHGLK